MLSKKILPKTKNDLVKAIQSKTPLKFTIFEYASSLDKNSVTKMLNDSIQSGQPFSMIIVKQ
jgi:hypothetical protein